MAIVVRKTNSLWALIALAINAAVARLGPKSRYSGVTTLVGGTKTVSSVTITPTTEINVTCKTIGGTPGELTATGADRVLGVGSGSFDIDSASGTDTSVVDYEVINTWSHLDPGEMAIVSPDASSLDTSLALVNELAVLFYGPVGARGTWPGHVNDDLAHKAVDTVSTCTAARNVLTLANAIILANEIKADYNIHRVSTTFHHAADSANVVAAANASDQGTLNTLLNEIKVDLAAHVAAAPSAAPGAMMRLVDG